MLCLTLSLWRRLRWLFDHEEGEWRPQLLEHGRQEHGPAKLGQLPQAQSRIPRHSRERSRITRSSRAQERTSAGEDPTAFTSAGDDPTAFTNAGKDPTACKSVKDPRLQHLGAHRQQGQHRLPCHHQRHELNSMSRGYIKDTCGKFRRKLKACIVVQGSVFEKWTSLTSHAHVRRLQEQFRVRMEPQFMYFYAKKLKNEFSFFYKW